ncbi:hypothetical protein V5O39_02195 [Pseudomonas parakoreensis]
MLQTLFENSGEPQLTAYLQTSRGSLLQVDATADQCSFSFNRRDGSIDRYVIDSVSRASSSVQAFQQALLSIGAHLRSDRLLPLSQLLRESGFTFADAPDAAALTRLIGKVEEQCASHRLSLRPLSTLTVMMSDEDKAAAHDVIGAWLIGKSLSAIDSLASEVTPPFTLQQLEQQPATCLERLLDTPQAHDLGLRLLQKLQWYGARPDELTVPISACVYCSKRYACGTNCPATTARPKWPVLRSNNALTTEPATPPFAGTFYSIWRILTEPRRRSRNTCWDGSVWRNSDRNFKCATSLTTCLTPARWSGSISCMACTSLMPLIQGCWSI